MIVISGYSSIFTDIGIPNSARWAAYCDRHGHEWMCGQGPSPQYPGDSKPYWHKYTTLNDVTLHANQPVVWVDIDIIVHDLDYDLASALNLSSRNILISSDAWGLCTAFMMIRPTAWSRQFFAAVQQLQNLEESLQKRLYSNVKHDQNTVKYLYDGFESVSRNFFLLGEDVVSLPDGNAPLKHYWSSASPDGKAKMLGYFDNQENS
jgi:hypothetical protein